MDYNEENILELDDSENCYHSTWDLFSMWYKRALKLQKLKEQEMKKK